MESESPIHEPFTRRRIRSALFATAGSSALAACGQSSAAADDVVKELGGPTFFLDALLSAWQYQGGYFGLPLYVFPRMFYYRKDLFQDKGLQPGLRLGRSKADASAATC